MQFRSLRSDAGFTLIEVLVASVVLVVGVLGSLTVFDRANQVTVDTRAREGATNLAREITEAARGVQYDRIEPTSLPGTLADQPGLEDARPSTAAYELERRGFTYAVSLASCIMDDPRDGGGDQAAGGFCPGSAAPNSVPASSPKGTVDRNPEDYKQVTATVAWTVQSRSRTVTQDVVVNNPGSSAGPSVRTVSIQGLNTSQPVVASGTSVRVVLETSYKPATTNWTLDAAVQAPKPVEGAHFKQFVVDWNHGTLVDGTYVVGAEAYDKWGIAGPGKSLSVVLNRFKPAPPTGFAGGRNGDSLVELAWRANVEKDIVGYTVERCVGSCAPEAWDVVCSLENRTSCEDTAPPPPGSDAQIAYRVRAWDRSTSGDPRTGTALESASAELRLPADNPPPPDPADVRVFHGAGGSATIRWRRPADDPADPVAFYRVYRDGTSLANRYTTAESAAGIVEAVDGETGGQQRRYWVTAVDKWFRESAKIEATVGGTG